VHFEPATFAAYDTPVPHGVADPPSPYDPTDAVAAAFAYNHASRYVIGVLDCAQAYGQTGGQTVANDTVPGIAVDWPSLKRYSLYMGWGDLWGGETPDVGFDCSGRVQAATRSPGSPGPDRPGAIRRDDQARGPDDPLEPGALVFFGGGPSDVTHIGIYVGAGQMVDARYTGADVRVQSFPTTVGPGFTTSAPSPPRTAYWEAGRSSRSRRRRKADGGTGSGRLRTDEQHLQLGP